jgi:hypothetical protein
VWNNASNVELNRKHVKKQGNDATTFTDICVESDSSLPSTVGDNVTFFDSHQPRLLTPSSPCKLLMDIVRESHLSAFPHQTPNNQSNQSRDAFYDTPTVFSSSNNIVTSSLTLPHTFSRPHEISDRPRPLSSAPMTFTETNVHCIPQAVSPQSETNFTVERSCKVAVASVKTPPDAAASQSVPTSTSSVTLHVLPAQAVKSNVQSQRSQNQSEPVEKQYSLSVIRRDFSCHPSTLNSTSIATSSTELTSPRYANDDYNVITNALDSVIARLSNDVSSVSATEVNPQNTARCTERRNGFEQFDERDTASPEQLSDESAEDTSSSWSSGSSCSADPHLTNLTYQNRVGHSRLSAELKVVQRRLAFQSNKDDSFNREDSPVNHSLPLPRKSIIKRHRHRQERRRTSSLSASSSSTSSSLSSVSTESRCEVSSHEHEERRRNDRDSERRNRKHRSGDISPVVSSQLTELDWHIANNS